MVRLCGFAPLIGEWLSEMGRHSQADRMSPPEAQVAPLRSIPFHSIRFSVVAGVFSRHLSIDMPAFNKY